MQYINGGTYNKRKFSCMYDAIQIMNNQDRYDKNNDLVGIIGIEEMKNPNENHPAMLWFSGDKVSELKFIKGETYFPNIDKTESELYRLSKEEFVKELLENR